MGDLFEPCYESRKEFQAAHSSSCLEKVSGRVSVAVIRSKQKVSDKVNKTLTSLPSPKNYIDFSGKLTRLHFDLIHSDQPLICSFITTGSRRIFNFPF